MIRIHYLNKQILFLLNKLEFIPTYQIGYLFKNISVISETLLKYEKSFQYLLFLIAYIIIITD